MNEGALTKAQFLPLCQGQILKADPILKKKKKPFWKQPYARNRFWLSFHITVNRNTRSCSQGVSLMCWEWHSAVLSHMEVWITRSWVCRKWDGEGSSEAVLVWQVHYHLVTEIIKMDTACSLAASFQSCFLGSTVKKERPEIQSRSALLPAIKASLSCSTQPSCRFFLQDMSCSRFNNHVAKQSCKAMRQSGISDAILMDLLKTYIKPWRLRYRRRLSNMR